MASIMKTLSKRIILHQPPWLTVEQHEVELPNGQSIHDWPWVITPDWINVLPQTEDGNFLLFRQGKYGFSGTSLAVVGGYIFEGEDPLSAAKRELLEEMGCEAAEWIDLGHYLVDPNRGVANGHLYLARGAHQVVNPHSDDLEEQQLLRLTRLELEDALMRGEFKVLAWAATAIFSLHALDKLR
jgi:ADP-ribose pyrophosphatase